MMIGGKIVEVIFQNERVFLNVQDETYQKDRCGIYVKSDESSLQIETVDKCWWQGDKVFWTRPFTTIVDVPLERASYSGVDHPHGNDVLDHAFIEGENDE